MFCGTINVSVTQNKIFVKWQKELIPSVNLFHRFYFGAKVEQKMVGQRKRGHSFHDDGCPCDDHRVMPPVYDLSDAVSVAGQHTLRLSDRRSGCGSGSRH